MFKYLSVIKKVLVQDNSDLLDSNTFYPRLIKISKYHLTTINAYEYILLNKGLIRNIGLVGLFLNAV